MNNRVIVPRESLPISALKDKVGRISYYDSFEAQNCFPVLEVGKPYLLTDIREDLNLFFKKYHDVNYKTNLNHFYKQGLYLLKADDCFPVGKRAFSQFDISSAIEVNTGNSWNIGANPWDNSLALFKRDNFYLVNISLYQGVSIAAGELNDYVELVGTDQIFGNVIKSGDFLAGVSLVSENKTAELRFYPVYSASAISLVNHSLTFTLDGNSFSVFFHGEYIGRPFTITIGDLVYSGVFDKDMHMTEVVRLNASITYKPRVGVNNLYDKRSMFAFVGDRIMHIRFAFELLANEFYIRYLGNTFRGRFKPSLIDNPIILEQVV